ncbi:unnamed protein product [Boreogadus saida]
MSFLCCLLVFVTQIYFYRCLVHSEVNLQDPFRVRCVGAGEWVGGVGLGWVGGVGWGPLGKTGCAVTMFSLLSNIRRLYFSQTLVLCLFLCNINKDNKHKSSDMERATLSDDHCIGIQNVD